MNRRDFLQDVLIAAPALAWAQQLPVPGRSLLASQTEIARAPLRPEDDARLKQSPTEGALKGTRYPTQAPDTLDLAERLKLSLIALTNRWFPQFRWAEGFHVFPGRPFAMPVGVPSDFVQMVPKFAEAFVLARLASGSDLNLAVDRNVLATQLGMIGEDGLSYVPPDSPPDDALSARYRGTFTRNAADVFGEGRWLMALTMLAQVDQDSRWEALARKKIDRLLTLSSEKEGFRYFWNSGGEPHSIGYRPGETPPPNAPEPQPPKCEDVGEGLKSLTGGSCDPAELPMPCMIVGQGAAQFYRLTHYAPALELARGMAQWALVRIFNRADGRFFVERTYESAFVLMAVAWYGGVAEDAVALRRADACYRWARDMGDPLVGWYPPYMPGSEVFEKDIPQHMEVCGVVTLVNLALYLSRHGIGDYWDDVDRWVRNRVAASQVTDLKFLEGIPAEYLSSAPFSEYPVLDTRDMAARTVGGCFSGMVPNDGFPVRRGKDGRERVGGTLASCCVVNPARAMYYVWDSIVTGTENDIHVNLLLNRASEWVDVDSYLPVEGKVVVKVKKTNKVKVRMSEWIALDGVVVSLNQRRIDPAREGRYLGVSGLRPRDEIMLTFPVPERTVNRVIALWPYKLTLRGSQVVGIDPPGKGYPLYREQPQGKLVEKERFIATKRVIW